MSVLLRYEMAKSFAELVRARERKCFPEFAKSDIYAPPREPYFYFSPSWHVRYGLVTKEIINSLRQGDKAVLSVGAGSAYLERFLVRHFHVPREVFTLADVRTQMPSSFSQEVFDMFEPWPSFTKLYDYVLFPESLLIKTKFHYEHEQEATLRRIVQECLIVLKPGGEARSDGHCLDEELVDLVRLREGCTIEYAPNLLVVRKD